METLHELLYLLVEFSTIVMEFFGVVVILVSGIQAAYNYSRHDPHARLKLCRAMAMALEFKLGAEILHTVIVKEFSDLALVGCTILLRAALSFLIHIAIKSEEKEDRDPSPKAQALWAEEERNATISN